MFIILQKITHQLPSHLLKFESSVAIKRFENGKMIVDPVKFQSHHTKNIVKIDNKVVKI